MLKYAYALSRDSDLACDLVQDSVVKALSARALPAQHESYRPWLFQILRNVFFDHLRRKKRLTAYTSEMAHDDAQTVPEYRTQDVMVDGMTVRAGLDRLSGPHREILLLVDVAGFSYDEVAAILEVRRGTVMSRLSRARHSLRQEVTIEIPHEPEQMRHRQDLKAGQ